MTKGTFLRPGIDFQSFSAFLAQVQESREERRKAEILAWSADTGKPLPMQPGTVVAFEDAGAVVDLDTGMITWPDRSDMDGMAIVLDLVRSEA